MNGLLALSNSNLGAGMGIPENNPEFLWQVATKTEPPNRNYFSSDTAYNEAVTRWQQESDEALRAYYNQMASQSTTPIPTGDTVAPGTTAAELARQEQEAAQSYRKLGFLMSRAGYDFGQGSTRRNMMFSGDRGLSGLDGWWTDLEPQNRALMGAAVLVAALIILGRK
jgi:hypothetical protein